MKLHLFLLPAVLSVASLSAFAISDTKLEQFVGYTLIKVSTITGWVDKDGKQEDAFMGCEFGRKLIIDYNLQVTCKSYGYHYSYHPKALFFSNGSLKMLVDDDVYDVSSP